jgi:hypothetical protein
MKNRDMSKKTEEKGRNFRFKFTLTPAVTIKMATLGICNRPVGTLKTPI